MHFLILLCIGGGEYYLIFKVLIDFHIVYVSFTLWAIEFDGHKQ